MSIIRNNGRNGFTLVEILMAIAIYGLIAGAVSATFHTAITTWRGANAAADAMHHADNSIDQIYMALRSAYYPEASAPMDKYGFSHEDEGGDQPKSRDVISWVKLGSTLIGEDTPYAGVPHRVEVSMMDDDGPFGPGLYVRSWRLDGQPDDFDVEDDTIPVLISSAVVGFNCQMMDPDKRSNTVTEEINWLDDWEQTNRVPEAVRISLAVASPSPKQKPMIIERYIEIPISELSWNPVITGDAGRGSRGGRGGRGGARGIRGEGAAPGGAQGRGTQGRGATQSGRGISDGSAPPGRGTGGARQQNLQPARGQPQLQRTTPRREPQP
jgi:prepilin-type N-terminal cleavage/methylation domain-containing protein